MWYRQVIAWVSATVICCCFSSQAAALCLINNTNYDSLLFQMRCSLLDSNCSRMLRVKRRARVCYGGVGYITVMKQDPALCSDVKLPKTDSILLATNVDESQISCRVVENPAVDAKGKKVRLKSKDNMSDDELAKYQPVQKITMLISSMAQMNRQILNREISELEARHGINVSIEEADTSEIQKILLSHALAGTLPNIVIAPSDVISLREYMKLSPIPKAQQNKFVAETALSSVNIDGQYYGAPIYDGNFLMMYYNKDLVEYPSKSFEAILHNRGGARANQLIGWPTKSPFWFIVFASAFGLQLTSEYADNMTVSTIEQTLDFYDNLSLEGYVESFCDAQCQAHHFLSGNRKYIISGEWFIDDAVRLLGDKVGIMQLPTLGNKNIKAYRSSIAIMFPSNGLQSNNKDLLLAFAQHIQSGEVQRRFSATSFRIPVHTEIRKEMVTESNKLHKIWRQVIPLLDDAVPLPPSKSLPHIWNGLGIGINAFFDQSVNAHEAAEIIVESAEMGLAE